mgnify:FL=1|jgi:hypothetical protein|tara:strand:+ start:417 stop:548 length:132 start_codon:yes stop_codon:yes gene_type:complete
MIDRYIELRKEYGLIGTLFLTAMFLFVVGWYASELVRIIGEFK